MMRNLILGTLVNATPCKQSIKSNAKQIKSQNKTTVPTNQYIRAGQPGQTCQTKPVGSVRFDFFPFFWSTVYELDRTGGHDSVFDF